MELYYYTIIEENTKNLIFLTLTPCEGTELSEDNLLGVDDFCSEFLMNKMRIVKIKDENELELEDTGLSYFDDEWTNSHYEIGDIFPKLSNTFRISVFNDEYQSKIVHSKYRKKSGSIKIFDVHSSCKNPRFSRYEYDDNGKQVKMSRIDKNTQLPSIVFIKEDWFIYVIINNVSILVKSSIFSDNFHCLHERLTEFYEDGNMKSEGLFLYDGGLVQMKSYSPNNEVHMMEENEIENFIV